MEFLGIFSATFTDLFSSRLLLYDRTSGVSSLYISMTLELPENLTKSLQTLLYLIYAIVLGKLKYHNSYY